jgi:alanine racemase
VSIRLTVDLKAIADNWSGLRAQLRGSECAAVVKADGYGLGLTRIAPCLWRAGCRSFFVACLAEAQELRQVLSDATIYILNGVPAGHEQDAFALDLIPVVNSLPDLARLKKNSPGGGPITLAFNVDTGMHRLGLDFDEFSLLKDKRELLEGVKLKLIMSHLTTPENQSHPSNKRQRDRFCKALEILPSAPASLAASSGIFLGKSFHFDMVRPGAALFGINPAPGQENPMRPDVTLEARILQVHHVQPGETVGYGGDWMIEKPTRIATVGIGYADGIPRRLGCRGRGFVGGHEVPFAGRVSMDLLTLDITAISPSSIKVGDWVEFIGPNRPLDDVAKEAETIGYEILTGLGQRCERVYLEHAQQEEV